MIKRLLIVFLMLFCGLAYGGQIVNVDYIHSLIAEKWGIVIPYNETLNDVRVAANMKYLLTTVDVANEILNGESTTDYGNGEFATMVAVDTVATDVAVNELIKKDIYKFFMTTTNTDVFGFRINADGIFYVDWGDGTTEELNGGGYYYNHSYDTPGVYDVKLGGKASGYVSGYSAIKFETRESRDNLVSIDGSLGEIFGTLEDGTQPSFAETFKGMGNLRGTIPENLFAGINGAPTEDMFYYTFDGCSGLTGPIPDGLFAGISGAPAEDMFYNTFYGCSGLTGPIPDGLFAGINGAPAANMFYNTFYGCSGLTGPIPDGLFAGISGAPAERMFSHTFYDCSGLTGPIPDGLFAKISGALYGGEFNYTFANCGGLTSIPENLFGDLYFGDVPYSYIFAAMFMNCVGLTGPSARINGQYLYDKLSDLNLYYNYGPYYGCTGLSDYSSMPVMWRSYND